MFFFDVQLKSVDVSQKNCLELQPAERLNCGSYHGVCVVQHLLCRNFHDRNVLQWFGGLGVSSCIFYPQVSGKDLEAQARTRSCGAWLLDSKEPGGR